MGLFDSLFKRIGRSKTKTLLLDEPKSIKEEKKTPKSIEKQDTKTEHSISIMDGKHGKTTITLKNLNINLIEIFEEETKEGFKKEDVLIEVQKAILPIFKASNKRSLDEAKKLAVSRLNELCSENSGVHLYKVGREYLENYETENIVNYEVIEHLPKVTDFKILPEEKKELMEKQLSHRLRTLESIKTPEDAYKDRENLIYFMQSQENLPISSIIDANIQSIEEGKQLDEGTVKRIAKNVPKLNNEDGALYSVYLKIEEKRIWEKIKHTLNRIL